VFHLLNFVRIAALLLGLATVAPAQLAGPYLVTGGPAGFEVVITVTDNGDGTRTGEVTVDPGNGNPPIPVPAETLTFEWDGDGWIWKSKKGGTGFLLDDLQGGFWSISDAGQVRHMRPI